MNLNEKTYSRKNIINNEENSLNSKRSNKSQKNKIDILPTFGNSKLVTDTSLNKHYRKYIQKQAEIQNEQKIYELIEQLDDPKVFRNLKEEFLREKSLLQNLHNKKIEDKRIIYNPNYINLHNCEEKLNSVYKLSAPDLNFMGSLMHFLGNRPKKVIKHKVNQKLIALSHNKLGYLRKKKEMHQKEQKEESNTNSNTNSKNNTIYYYKYQSSKKLNNPYISTLKESFDNTSKSNSNYINNLGNKKEKYNCNNYNVNNNNAMATSSEDFYKQYHSQNNLRKKSINLDINNQGNKQSIYGKTLSTNFGLTRSNNFYNKNNNPNETIYSNYNNTKTENFMSNSESQNNNSITEENILTNNNINNHNFQYNKRKNSKFNSQSSLFSLNNKSHNRSRRISSKDSENKINLKKNILDSKKSPKKNSEENDKKINSIFFKDLDDNKDLSILLNLKKHDKIALKDKLTKIYKNTMKEFLQKIKDEEKDLHSNSIKLSELLYKFKKYENFEEIKNKNIDKIKKKENSIIHTKSNYSLQSKKTIKDINSKYTQKKSILESEIFFNEKEKGRKLKTLTFYPSWGKSKYSIPYINKIVYGKENSIDTFEQLQKDLFFETKNEMRKAKFVNKRLGKKVISVKGKDILNKFKDDKDELLIKDKNRIIFKSLFK